MMTSQQIMDKAEKIIKTIEEDIEAIQDALIDPAQDQDYVHEVIDTYGKSLFLVDKQLNNLH